MNRRIAMGIGTLLAITLLVGWTAVATDARMYFASDKNGQNVVTNVQEGDSIWVVVFDPDENLDCDVRDKFWTDVKLMDPKTGARTSTGKAGETAPMSTRTTTSVGRWPTGSTSTSSRRPTGRAASTTRGSCS